MRSFNCVAPLLAIWCLAAASTVYAQTIRGVITAPDYSPIALARVTAIDAAGDSIDAVLTNVDGVFSLAGPDRLFVIRVTALGYRSQQLGPFELEEEDVRVVEVTLQPEPVAIEGLLVEATNSALAATGFYERRELGRGQFLTPDEIAASNARFTPELFHDLNHVVPQYATPMWSRWVQLRSAAARGNCVPRLWVDGNWVRWRSQGEGLDDVVPREDVLAIELYWGPFQAPLRYQGTTVDNDCGVVLIWTRSGVRRPN